MASRNPTNDLTQTHVASHRSRRYHKNIAPSRNLTISHHTRPPPLNAKTREITKKPAKTTHARPRNRYTITVNSEILKTSHNHPPPVPPPLHHHQLSQNAPAGPSRGPTSRDPHNSHDHRTVPCEHLLSKERQRTENSAPVKACTPPKKKVVSS